ncbi:hypothetical protein [Ilumatobacter sp.]|uniref:hypothetical protein n=1 Tax=Ilumatobacter sp. TaxID=1967498 RepID=UPI003AF44468
MQRVEFTIEPFHEGDPGPHVTAPAEALRDMDIDVQVGPFGSGCRVADDRVSDVVAAIVRIALDHGASHVNVDIETAS